MSRAHEKPCLRDLAKAAWAVLNEVNSVFISYRREGGAEMARLVWDALHDRGYEVFMDVEDLRGGPYKTALLEQIESSNDFVVILTPNSLDRSHKEGDWLRTEISHAIKHNRNVIPVIMHGFTWPASLPDDIAALPNLEGLEPSHNFFDASMDRLARLLTAMPVKATWLRKAMATMSWPSKRVFRCTMTIGGIVAVLACGALIMTTWKREPSLTNDRWLTKGEYQRQFDAKSADFYPVEIQGRCHNGHEEFRAVWKSQPPGTFYFESYNAMTKQEFDDRNNTLQAQGYSLEAYPTSFQDCNGVTRYAATWLKKN